MTSPLTIQHWGGKVTDPESGDVNKNDCRELLNVDTHVGHGIAMPRAALVQDETTAVFGFGTGASKHVDDIVVWNSGIESQIWNKFVVYRSDAANPSGEYTWTFATDAPNGGAGGAFVDLSGSFVSKTCDADASGGVVRVGLGPALQGMIFMNLCSLGDREFPNFTIASTDSTVPSGIRDYAFGEGGKLYAGWLWDYERLYVNHKTATPGGSFDFMTEGVSTIWDENQYAAELATGTEVPLAKRVFYEFFAAFVYDDDPEQYALFVTDDMSGVTTRFETTLDGTDNVVYAEFRLDYDAKFSRRIRGIAVYCRTADTASALNGDFDRIVTLPVDGTWTLVSGTEYKKGIRIDMAMIASGENSVWSADSGGRPVPRGIFAGEELTGFSFATGTAFAQAWYVEQNSLMSVNMSGLLFHRETMYAWGISNDPGQSNIAYSTFSGRRGMYDVYNPLNQMRKGDNLPITYVEEFNDKLYLFQSSNIIMASPPTAIGANIARYLGTGTNKGTDIIRSIAKGPRGIYYCNHDTVLELEAGGTFNDLLLKQRKEEWQALTDAQRSAAIGHYNGHTEEYWLYVNGRIWIYRARYEDRKWRDYTVPAAFTLRGFYTDPANGNTMLFGDHTTLGSIIAYMGDRTGKDFEGAGGSYAGDAISFALETQRIGSRNNFNIIDYIDFQRLVSTDTAPTVKLYKDELTNPSATVKFPSTRTKRANITPIRCREIRIRVEGTVDASNASRIQIRELTIGSKREEKRRE